MSGTGDVVITEIWKSSAVLVFGKDIAGKIYIHNRDNVLLVELKKNRRPGNFRGPGSGVLPDHEYR